MNDQGWVQIAVGAAAGTVGLWLLLPRGTPRFRRLGWVLAALTLSAFLTLAAPRLDGALADAVFLSLAGLTLVAAVATVAARKPVYSAIWFAVVLLATSGLLLFQGAQFLGLATIVVYAGAILVTFLFVLMLASPKGTDVYDRVSWEGFLGAAAGMALTGVMLVALRGALAPPDVGRSLTAVAPAAAAAERQSDLLAPDHMAHLGGQLFSRHLLAVEFGGTLLLVGLVGAVAMAAHERPGSRAGLPIAAGSGEAP